MNTKPRFLCKLPYDWKRLNDKTGELSYQTGDILVTALGKFMVAPGSDGLCRVMFQFLDKAEGKWIRFHLRQEFVDKLVFPQQEDLPITCKEVLTRGFCLDTETGQSGLKK